MSLATLLSDLIKIFIQIVKKHLGFPFVKLQWQIEIDGVEQNHGKLKQIEQNKTALFCESTRIQLFSYNTL